MGWMVHFRQWMINDFNYTGDASWNTLEHEEASGDRDSCDLALRPRGCGAAVGLELRDRCFFLTIIFFGGRITNASAILALRRRAWSTTNSFLIGVMPRGAITSASSIGRAQKHRPVARRSIFDGLTTRTDGWEVKIGNPACFKCYLCRQPLMQALASGQILPDGPKRHSFPISHRQQCRLQHQH